LGVIGAGRIGAAYATKMVRGFEMNLIYYDMYENKAMEDHLNKFSEFIGRPLEIRRAETVEDLLQNSDIISLNCLLTKETKHIIN